MFAKGFFDFLVSSVGYPGVKSVPEALFECSVELKILKNQSQDMIMTEQIGAK